MAIEKVEKGSKVQWTLASILQMAGAGVLLLGALLLGYVALSNGCAKAGIVGGFEAYDSNQSSAAERQLLSALSWKPQHPGARECLAKIACDAGQLDKAERQYQELRAQNYDPPQVKVGLGVLYLKKADLAAKTQEAQGWVEKAQGEFRGAGGTPEAEVGLGHCRLLLAHKLGNPKFYDEARVIFTKVRNQIETSAEYRARITRDGLVDYYVGLARALSSGSPSAQDVRDSIAALKACSQYTRRWHTPMANVTALEARRWASLADPAEIGKLDAEATAIKREIQEYWNRNRDAENLLKEPWVAFQMSLAGAYARAGMPDKVAGAIKDLTSDSRYRDRPEPYLQHVKVLSEQALREDLAAGMLDRLAGALDRASSELDISLKNVSDPVGKERKARAQNDLGFARVLRGDITGNDSYYNLAEASFRAALALFPEDYTYNRNMALLLKRRKRPANAIQPFVEKAKAAAAGDLAADFEKVQQVLGGK
jgi:Flp pilus assembly protein TadD